MIKHGENDKAWGITKFTMIKHGKNDKAWENMIKLGNNKCYLIKHGENDKAWDITKVTTKMSKMRLRMEKKWFQVIRIYILTIGLKLF